MHGRAHYPFILHFAFTNGKQVESKRPQERNEGNADNPQNDVQW